MIYHYRWFIANIILFTSTISAECFVEIVKIIVILFTNIFLRVSTIYSARFAYDEITNANGLLK